MDSDAHGTDPAGAADGALAEAKQQGFGGLSFFRVD
jgi:hypothetical protein